MLPRFAQSAYRFTPLTAHLFAVLSATPKKGTVEAKASTALFRLPIVLQKPPALVCGVREYPQGTLPPAPPASPTSRKNTSQAADDTSSL